jgi:hydroxyacylglutathione hydrolase
MSMMEPVLAELDRLGWGLDLVLNTHWHADHAGGNAEVKVATGCELLGPAEVTGRFPVDRVLTPGCSPPWRPPAATWTCW